MKFLTLACLLTFTSLTGKVAASNNLSVTELSLDDVFVIKKGFDDNDNVQVVLDGTFDNLCQELGETKFSLDQEKRVISLVQYSTTKQIPDCRNSYQRQSYPSTQWRLPFSHVVNLGQLAAGQYTVVFKGKGGTVATRTFAVDAAQTSSADSFFYAPISGLFVPELIFEGNNVDLILSGVLGTSCFDLFEENIKVSQTDKTIVVLPVLQRSSSDQCEAVLRPIQLMLDLGKLTSGRYLVHVRSMTGQALNKVFTVAPKNTPNRSH